MCRRFVATFVVVAALSANVSGKGRSAEIALAMSFEANPGQIEPQIKYISRGPGYTLFLRPTEATLALYKTHSAGVGAKLFVVRMQFPGGNPQPVVEGLDELSGKANYFVGNDPEH